MEKMCIMHVAKEKECENENSRSLIRHANPELSKSIPKILSEEIPIVSLVISSHHSRFLYIHDSVEGTASSSAFWHALFDVGVVGCSVAASRSRALVSPPL